MKGPPRRANNGRAINRVKALPGAASSHGTGLLLQLGSDFREEPSCSIGEGSGADIARFGIVAEAPIFPKSDPIARIHSVFGIDQMLQGLHVDFPSGLLDRSCDTQQRPVLVILLAHFRATSRPASRSVSTQRQRFFDAVAIARASGFRMLVMSRIRHATIVP